MYFSQQDYDYAEPPDDWIFDAMESEGLNPEDRAERMVFLADLEQRKANDAIDRWEAR